jgi:hypothetical protein
MVCESHVVNKVIPGSLLCGGKQAVRKFKRRLWTDMKTIPPGRAPGVAISTSAVSNSIRNVIVSTRRMMDVIPAATSRPTFEPAELPYKMDLPIKASPMRDCPRSLIC